MPSALESRGGPSSAPGPLAKFLGKLIRSLPSPHQQGPLHGVLGRAGKSQLAFKPTPGTMQNLASNYGTRTIDYRTAPVKHPSIPKNLVGKIFPANQHTGTLARQSTPVNNVGSIFPSNQHAGTLARQAKSILNSGKKITVAPQQINGVGPGDPGPTVNGGISLPHAPVGKSTSTTTKSTGIDPLLTQAQETISAQMDPQLADLQNQINDAVSGGNRQQADLAELYRRLGVQNDAQKAAGDTANANALSSIGGNYDALASKLKDIFSNAAGDTGNELQRLGIQQVAPAALAGQAKDSNYVQGLVATDKANALSNATSKGQSFDNLLTVLHSQGQLSGADKTANAMALARQTIQDLSNKKGALAATRRAAVDSLYRQLTTAKTQAQADKAQQNFMNQIALGKLGISQGQLGVAQGKLGVDQGKLAATNALLPYNMNLKTAQTASALHSANAPYKTTSPTTDLKGFGGGLKLLQSVKTNAASKSALGTAMNLFKYYQTKYGANAFNKMMTHKGGGDQNYNALPPELRGALQDAFTVAQKK